MASIDDVKKLAALARITLTDEECARFAGEFDRILAYVGQVEQVSSAGERAKPIARNVMREDGDPHESGEYTDALAAQFPDREGNALRVKQIVSYD